MTPDYWEKRCRDTEERLHRMCDKVLYPPISILHINYKDQAEKQHAKLKQFRRLFGRLYWYWEPK